jgi:hypothetical protein
MKRGEETCIMDTVEMAGNDDRHNAQAELVPAIRVVALTQPFILADNLFPIAC